MRLDAALPRAMVRVLRLDGCAGELEPALLNVRTPNLSEFLGCFIALAGLALLLSPLSEASWIEPILPGASQMALNSKLLFVAAGGCCVCLSAPLRQKPWSRRLSLLGIGLLLMLPSLVLAEHLLDWDLGIDLLGHSTQLAALDPHPGRIAPNACLAFLAAGLSFLWIYAAPRDRSARPFTGALAALSLIGVAGLIGHLLQLESLYRMGDFNRMSPITAVGLTLLAVALWLMHDEFVDIRGAGMAGHERQIVRRAFVILVLVAMAGGVGSYVVMRSSFEQSISDSMLLTASTNATALSNLLDQALALPRSIASRAPVVAAMAKLDRAPNDAASREALLEMGRGLLSTGLDGIEFRSGDGRLHAAAGALQPQAQPLARLQVDDLEAELRWRDGYWLHTEHKVPAAGGSAGRIITERRLSGFDQLLLQMRSGESSDALLCSRDGDAATCPPTRFYPRPFRVPMVRADGQPNLPINRALLGQSGAMVVTDLRGIAVVAAFVPLRPYGLGLVVKSDARSAYAPLRERLQWLAALLGVLILIGTLALRVRVRPLLDMLLSAQRRTRTILDNSGDAFVAIGADGRVTDWNAQAERTFGWTASQALGRDLAELIIPPAQREAHRAGLARFAQTGEGAVLNRRIELSAIHRSGRVIPIELAVAAIHDGGGYLATAFLRDISERLAAAQSLAASERRLRAITDNVPALISQFDHDARLVFVNPRCAQVYGMSQDRMLGLTVEEVRGEESQRQLQPFIDQVLAGRSVEFESRVVVKGEERFFRQNYVPDLGADGSVRGFYSVSFEITESKRAEQRLAASEKRLRDITNNLPVLISYIDAQQRLRFLNATYEAWMGVEREALIGRSIEEDPAAQLYGPGLPQLLRALAGERVGFDGEFESSGVRRYLKTEYIPDQDEAGTVQGVYTLSSDVTELKTAELQLAELAHFDSLTGLANRHQFNQRIVEALDRADRSGEALALMFLDVDHFKSINDSMGHAAGDAVLKQFAARLKHCVRKTDTVARLAGDEFVIILESLQDADQARFIGGKIVAQIGQPFSILDRPLAVTTSVGIAFHSSGPMTPADLLATADAALYEAKAAGRNTFRMTKTCSLAGQP